MVAPCAQSPGCTWTGLFMVDRAPECPRALTVAAWPVALALGDLELRRFPAARVGFLLPAEIFVWVVGVRVGGATE